MTISGRAGTHSSLLGDVRYLRCVQDRDDIHLMYLDRQHDGSSECRTSASTGGAGPYQIKRMVLSSGERYLAIDVHNLNADGRGRTRYSLAVYMSAAVSMGAPTI